jgi:DNA-binding NarL/FixJ family response regulator
MDRQVAVATRPRVLVADDHPGLVTAIGRLLAFDCDVVGSVGDGGALPEAAGRLHPDVIVLDLNMPKVNGLEACRHITRTIPGVKVIVLTAAGDTAIRQAALAAGASAFIVKQSIAEELPSTIKRVCAR